VFARKASDQTLTAATSSVQVDITDLNFVSETFGADEVWYIDGFIRYQAESTGDLKLQWSLPSGASIVGRWGGPPKGASSIGAVVNFADIGGTDADEGSMGGVGVTAADIITAPIAFLLIMDDTLGDCKVTGGQVATNATKPIILANSILRATQVG